MMERGHAPNRRPPPLSIVPGSEWRDANLFSILSYPYVIHA